MIMKIRDTGPGTKTVETLYYAILSGRVTNIFMFSELKRYTAFTVHIISRDMKERYAGSYLGFLWNFIYPIFFLIVYWFVFSKVIRIKVPVADDSYLPFLFSGLFPWYAIQDGIFRGTTSIIDKGYIIKKVLLPHELFPLAATISSLIHHSIGFIIFLVIFSLWKGLPSFEVLLFFPLLYFLQLAFSFGWALLLSSIAVYFRDMVHVIGILLQGIFFLSPILYPPSALPQQFAFILRLNPLTPLLEGYRAIIVYGDSPDLGGLLYFAVFSAIITFIGFIVFRKLKAGFVDVL
jgi:lipopolysaccharide transport system permease protein